MAEPRYIAWVDPAWFVKGHGFRVSIVKEGEEGHYPTGVWPNDGTKNMPWFWGPTLEDAEKTAIEYNRKLGVEPVDAEMILLQSMGLFPKNPTKTQIRDFKRLFTAKRAPAKKKTKRKKK
jgi:hypothetical protein